MSLSINYTTTCANWTVCDYLADWAGYFGDADHRIGDTGGFFVDG